MPQLRQEVTALFRLKGTAANVGATRVRETAAALEMALKEGAAPERVDALLADGLDALRAAHAALRTELPSPTSAAATAGTPIDLAAARADLAELEPLLRGHRLVRKPLLDRLRDHLGDQAVAELDSLIAQIQAFNFAQALDTLKRLEEKLLP